MSREIVGFEYVCLFVMGVWYVLENLGKVFWKYLSLMSSWIVVLIVNNEYEKDL